MKKLILFITLVLCSFAHAQTDDKEMLQRAAEKAVSFYQRERYDDALEFARQALDLNIKIYGSEHRETALAYNNLGAIYRALGKYKEATENLQKSVDIYGKISGDKGAEEIKAYGTLAFAQYLDSKEKQAEVSYLKAVELAENKYGQQSKESFSPVLDLARFYARSRKMDKSDEQFLQAYALAVKFYGSDSREVDYIDETRICSTVWLGDFKHGKEKAFAEARAKIFGVGAEAQAKGNVVNGKALSLPQPAYPPEAKKARLSGVVPIKVKIDENGNVIQAVSICRNDVLGRAAQTAAFGAKFSVTLFDGKPITVTGFITYNFIL